MLFIYLVNMEFSINPGVATTNCAVFTHPQTVSKVIKKHKEECDRQFEIKNVACLGG